jgi:HEPN domain-containing protein
MNEAKRLLVRTWLVKAEHDLASAQVLAKNQVPLLDTAIYHCQQAAEKAVKAFLAFCDEEVERIHDVEALVRRSASYEPRFGALLEAGRHLTPYARVFRYPGELEEPTGPQFAQAFSAAQGIWHFVLSVLPDEVHPPLDP